MRKTAHDNITADVALRVLTNELADSLVVALKALTSQHDHILGKVNDVLCNK